MFVACFPPVSQAMAKLYPEPVFWCHATHSMYDDNTSPFLLRLSQFSYEGTYLDSVVSEGVQEGGGGGGLGSGGGGVVRKGLVPRHNGQPDDVFLLPRPFLHRSLSRFVLSLSLSCLTLLGACAQLSHRLH
jgi:hypothetical protein